MFEDIEEIRSRTIKKRFSVWRSIMQDLERTADPEHSVVHFPNSSTYFFSTGIDTFWMMDPCYNQEPCNELERKQIADLIREKISFILITHLHQDHCQSDFVNELKKSPICWVVSERFYDPFVEAYQIPERQIVVLRDGESTEFSGIHIESQCGYHNEQGKPEIPECSYNIRLPDGVKLFFPSDVRDYSLKIPYQEDSVDYIFGHVFLGREDARGNQFSQLEAFCRFMTKRKSYALLLTHLYATGRSSYDLWTHRHAAMIEEKIRKYASNLKVIAPHAGDALCLSPNQR